MIFPRSSTKGIVMSGSFRNYKEELIIINSCYISLCACGYYTAKIFARQLIWDKRKNHEIKFLPIWAGRWKKFRLFGIRCIKFSNDNEIIINLPHWVWHDAENVCSSTKNWTHPVDQSGDFACHDDTNHVISQYYAYSIRLLLFAHAMS